MGEDIVHEANCFLCKKFQHGLRLLFENAEGKGNYFVNISLVGHKTGHRGPIIHYQ